jgi:hypothetical protein
MDIQQEPVFLDCFVVFLKLRAMTNLFNRHREAIKNGCGDPLKLNKI